MRPAILVAILAATLGFYAVNVVHYENTPLRVEEGVWPLMARAVHDHGIPSLPADEDHRVRIEPDFSVRTDNLNGLWHPPLYVSMLAGSMFVLGRDAAESLRLVGVLGLLACCALFFLISRELFGSRWPLVGTAASALLLVQPYAIQGSMFLDIDTTIYAPLFLLFTWLLVRFDREPPLASRPLLALAAAFALVLWAKVPTALVIVPVAALYWSLRHGPRRGLLRAGWVFGGGAALFLATYGLYVAATGQSFVYMFDFTLVGKGGRVVWKQGMSVLKGALNWHIEWFTPALMLLALAYGPVAVARWLREREVEPLDFVWGLGLAVWLAYAVFSPQDGYYQGKYAFPAIPLLVLAISGWLLRRDEGALDRRSLVLAVAVGALAAYAMPDLLTNRLFTGAGLELKAAIVLGSAAALWIAARGLRRDRLMPVGALVVCFTLFAAQSVHSYRAGTSPLYPVPDGADFHWEIAAINEDLGPGELALVSKDTGLYVGGKVTEGQSLWTRGGDGFEAQLLRREPRITVVSGDSFFTPVLGPETAAMLAECFNLQQSGAAVVYLRKPACRAGLREPTSGNR